MNRSAFRLSALAAAITAVFGLQACGGSSGGDEVNVKPVFIRGAISVQHYDGSGNDLLTAGLGKTGLMGAAPAYADPLNPSAAELRRNAIYNNYRALNDYTTAGGFGRLFGPNIDPSGADTLGEGKVAGTEYIAYADDGSGRKNVTMMVQVPDSFDKSRACIVTATSSGSRGVYGAIGTAGEWGLKRGCAVAYTDKGSGNGLHDLSSDKVTLIDGRLVPAAEAGAGALFRANVSAAELATFNAAYPNRVAFKHAHSGQNPEADWGANTLDAVRFAFYVLNEQFGGSYGDGNRKRRDIVPANTIVIASSVSNGGGAAIAAAEQDSEGLIDGVAVSEPNVQPRGTSGLRIRQGSADVPTVARPLLDYFSYANLYQPCASLSASAGAALSPLFWPEAFNTIARNRCSALRAKGLLDADGLAAQADEALGKLHAYGWSSEHDFLHQSHYRFATNSIAMTYVNTYGRFRVIDNVCGFSFANTDAAGAVVAPSAAGQAGIFASGNGVPPTTGTNIVYNDAVGAPTLDFLAVSPSSLSADFALDGALCIRALVTARDPVSGAALTGQMKSWSDRVLAGIADVQLSGGLRGKPAIIVAGRSDTLIPPNHASRAYYGRNRMTEGSASKLSYVEVTNAQHFDTFIAFGALLGYDTRFIPLHYYFGQAMDRMYAHLTTGAALPPSQVVRTTPRAGGESLTAAHMPAIAPTVNAADAITFNAGLVAVPD